jgi:branched-chain amino acid transport system permease protein
MRTESMEISQEKTKTGLSRLPEWALLALALLVLLALRFILSEFQVGVANDMLIIGLFALSLNLIMGYGGMVHFGHAAFYGMGGYATGILMAKFGWNAWLAMATAPFVSALLALLIGAFAVRRVGLYFSILTLAFGQLVYTLILNARDYSGGSDGLHGLVFPEIITNSHDFYLFTVIVFTACFLLIRVLVHSPFVLVLRAVRENAERAQFIAVDVRRHQLIIFVIGGFFAGVAGMLLVGKNHFIGIESLHWSNSAEPILASLMGGMFSLAGPIFGAGLLVFLNLFLTRIFSYWSLILGTLTVLIVLLAPTGILGLFQGDKEES